MKQGMAMSKVVVSELHAALDRLEELCNRAPSNFQSMSALRASDWKAAVFAARQVLRKEHVKLHKVEGAIKAILALEQEQK